jgi:hypothetical protein
MRAGEERSLLFLDSCVDGRGCRCTGELTDRLLVTFLYATDREAKETYLCDNHEQRLEKQRELKAVSEPEETTGDVGEETGVVCQRP